MRRFKSDSGACAVCAPRVGSQSCQADVHALDGCLETRACSILVRLSQLLAQRNMFKSVRMKRNATVGQNNQG